MKFNNHLTFVACLLTLASCYPDEEYLDTAELDTIVTFEPASADFSSKTTFAVSETVWDDSYDGYNGNYNNVLVAQIKQNMVDLGYSLVTNPSATNLPDIVIIPEIIFTNNYVVGGGGCYYGCWGWGWGGGWYGGWGYGPYYPPTYVVSYSTGTILMHMIDPTINGDQEINILWLGAIDGLLRNDLSHSELNSHVDQAFNQSSDYLSK